MPKKIDVSKLSKAERIAREKRLAYNREYDRKKKLEREGKWTKKSVAKTTQKAIKMTADSSASSEATAALFLKVEQKMKDILAIESELATAKAQLISMLEEMK